MKEAKIISKERKDYLKGIRKKKTIISIVQILILLILLSIWEIAARIGIIDSFITSQPSRILETFMNNINIIKVTLINFKKLFDKISNTSRDNYYGNISFFHIFQKLSSTSSKLHNA